MELTPEIQEELLAATKVKLREDEDATAFTKRVLTKANKLSDADYGDLSEDTQVWMNAALTAWEANEEIPLLCVEARVEEQSADDGSDDTEENDEMKSNGEAHEDEAPAKKKKGKKGLKAAVKKVVAKKEAAPKKKEAAASGAKKGRPATNGVTIKTACEFYNTLAEKAGLKVRQIKTTGFSGKPDAARALKRLEAGLKEAKIKPPVELSKYLQAFPE